VTGPGSSTLPIVIFSKVRLGVSPDINALATLLILAVAACTTVFGIYMLRQQKRRDLDVQRAIAAGD
jgi:putrescine transport system permease protein